MATVIGSGASKVSIAEEAPQRNNIQGVPTAVTGMVGVAESGPINQAVLCTSFEEYRRTFGRDVADGFLTGAARQFFDEGGGVLHAVRVVHLTDPDDATTKTSAAATLNLPTGATSPTAGSVLGTNAGPFDLTSGDTLVVSVDGGGNQTATFTGTAATRDTAGDEPYALANNNTLTLSVNGGSVQTVTFTTGAFADITNATRAEVAAVINAAITGAQAVDTGTRVRIQTDRKGTSATLNVTGGTGNGALGFTTGSISGGGNVADIDAVTVSEVETIVESAVTGVSVTNAGGAVRISSDTTGPSSSVQVIASSTADDELGLDNAVHAGTTGAAQDTVQVDALYDGTYANAYTLRVEAATDGVAENFDLVVLDDGIVLGRVPNLTMDSASLRYLETVLAGEEQRFRLTFTDLALSGTATERRPANGTYGPMTGGDDGLAGLVDADFNGSSVDKTGLYALDLVEDLSVLAVPGRATASVHNTMITYCEVWRDGQVFAVLDPPEGYTAAQMITYVESTAALLESSEFAAIYWPRILVDNPNQDVYGTSATVLVPPSGAICGVYARTDGSRVGGVYQPPAGVERGILRTARGLETDEVRDERKRDLVFPKRINPINQGTVRYIDGARTLKSTGNWPYVSSRRGVSFIEQSIRRGLEFARHSNNDPALRARVSRTISAFLKDQFDAGAFRGATPEASFFVDVSDALNTDDVVLSGRLLARVGLAAQVPAEFVLVTFSQLVGTA